jgi:hypothetical protein
MADVSYDFPVKNRKDTDAIQRSAFEMLKRLGEIPPDAEWTGVLPQRAAQFAELLQKPPLSAERWLKELRSRLAGDFEDDDSGDLEIALDHSRAAAAAIAYMTLSFPTASVGTCGCGLPIHLEPDGQWCCSGNPQHCTAQR